MAQQTFRRQYQVDREKLSALFPHGTPLIALVLPLEGEPQKDRASLVPRGLVTPAEWRALTVGERTARSCPRSLQDPEKESG